MQSACAILSPVALPTPQYFTTSSHKRHDFRKKKQEMCVLVFSTSFFETFLILRRNERYMIKNVHQSSCKVPTCYFSQIFEKKLNFLGRSSKNTQIYNFMNIRPVGAETFHADGQTDMTKLIVVIRKFQKAPKNGSLLAADLRHFNFSTAHFSFSLSLSVSPAIPPNPSVKKEFTHYLLSFSPSTLG